MVKKVNRIVKFFHNPIGFTRFSGLEIFALCFNYESWLKNMRTVTIISLFVISAVMFSCSSGMSVKEINEAVISAQNIYYSSSKWQDREKAIKSVENFETKMAFELKMEATGDTHSKVRVQAVKGLAPFVKDENVREKLMIMSRKDREVPVRYASLATLAASPDISMYSLFERYASNEDWLFREIAYRGIMGITDKEYDERSTTLLIRGLSDTQENVQITILENIKLQNDELYQSIRKNFFNKDYDKRITLLCATLKAVRGYNMDIRVRERVEQLILHQNRKVRVLALRALKSEPDYIKRNSREK